MSRSAKLALLALPLLVWALAAYAAAHRLKDIRIWAGPDHTRVVFDLSGAASHRVFVLDSPPRVVIDITGTERPEIMKGARRGKGLVKSVRTGVHNGKDVRVVLDLAERAVPTSFLIPPGERYGHRLVVDLNYPNAKPGDIILAPDVPNVAKAPFPGGPTTPGRVEPGTKPQYKPIVVAIDPGHGGEDPGAIGPTGAREKDVALSIARRLAKKINAESGMRAVLIRDGDYYIGLRQRTVKARQHQADLFVSIHADAFKRRSANGSSVYVLSDRGASSEYARALAKRENASDLVGGVQLTGRDDRDAFLLSVLQDTSLEASFDAAGRILKAIGRVNKLHKKDVQQAGFMVLKSPDIPSILIETAFISNRTEERNLRSSAHQEKLATAMMNGIKGYFASYRPARAVTAEGGPLPIENTTLEYVVQRGDTLSRIASSYSVSLRELKRSNNLKSNNIKVGQVLRIPYSVAYGG